MKNEKEVLQKLEIANMHVHVIDHSEGGYKGMPYPIALLRLSTHYVLKGNKIVHMGTPDSIERFALNL